MLVTVFPPDAKIAMQSDSSLVLPKVLIAAKTGTAQVVDPHGGLLPDGFLPLILRLLSCP